ncbi:sperm flagellar protein 1-like [Aedes albopictus]|uniref:Calponin-homology (CH) domain-containing protein n=1 Tax=Aedes albopictus TaxID=7160 RepID=A0ABM1ZEM3_AEDAL|nr:sperm flagellar protein 1-like [Aedes albopictus]
MLSKEEKSIIKQWLCQFQLSNPIRKVSRDLSDGVLVAELLHQLFPRMVDLHNYTKGFAVARKLDNWETLNRKVLMKLGIFLTPDIIHSVASGNQDTVFDVLLEIMIKAEQHDIQCL